MNVYTAKNYVGREIHISSRRDDIRHVVFIRDTAGDWTYRLSTGKNQKRILNGTLRAHPDAVTIRVVAAELSTVVPDGTH